MSLLSYSHAEVLEGIGRASFQAKYWPFPWYAASVHFSWAICTIGIIGPKVVTCLAVNGAEALVECSRPPLEKCFLQMECYLFGKVILWQC